ncbi:mechanosensitive ion channel family protein [Bacillus sp. S/N-304-OC-R1]|uniref:mechanosensitive ion channel family protein n=1 Tax=Bacillus sp. S/N-304-OC-R1 TaxID=2758034 RepID=UPI001C8DD1D3|nr:mechanosensitive ion channel family protein [Bacillus sp. S/N-304-OC-R1]MBY0121265.1 mechanosensitive ion channel family protein [Bacillus sp. S/N-304-OC-R1]
MLWEMLTSYENLKEIGIGIGIFLLFLLFRKIFVKDIFALLVKIGKIAPGEFLSQIFIAYEKPAQWLFIIIGIYFSAQHFPFWDHQNQLFLRIIRSSIILIITWGLLNLASSSSLFLKKLNASSKYNIEFDEILIPFLSKALQFVIVAISISVIAQEFHYDVNGFVAGLGLGGLAFALAAKDAIGNLFGGIIIITEKPFSIGDWIKTSSVEGIVEDISFRSTKVRTFAQALVTVPNATLANEAIMNWSKAGKRQISFNFKLPQDSSKEKIKRVIEEIEGYLKNNEDIHQDTILVNFDQYKDSGQEIFLNFYTKTTDWGEYLKIKEEFNYQIMDILEYEISLEKSPV